MCRLLALILLLGSFSAANDARVNASAKPTAKQQIALELLERVRLASAKTQPDVQAYLCQESASALATIQGFDAISNLRDCFRKTLLLDPQSEIRTTLQIRIATRLVALNDDVADLIAGADLNTKTVLLDSAISKDVGAKNFDDALSKLMSAPRNESFPYETAVKLMLALPSERDADRKAVFALALQSYRNQSSRLSPQLEDFATMVVRFWRHLPPQLVVEACDELLTKAKQLDESEVPLSLSIGTQRGEAHFDTVFAYRLFELLPVYQQLDATRAKSLLADRPEIAAVLGAYPNGLASLEPSFTDVLPSAGQVRRFNMTSTLKRMEQPGSSAQEMQYELTLRAVEKTVADVIADGAKFGSALVLPLRYPEGLQSPREDALGNIAMGVYVKNPELARAALRASRDSIGDLPPITQCHYLTGIANMYIRLGDSSAAASIIEQAMKSADAVYQRDTDREDPNTSFKLYWPSNAIYRAIVVLRSRVSPVEGSKLADSITDPDLRNSALSAVAEDLLGSPSITGAVIETHFKDERMRGGFPLTR
jgi:hypothetical protein